MPRESHPKKSVPFIVIGLVAVAAIVTTVLILSINDESPCAKISSSQMWTQWFNHNGTVHNATPQFQLATWCTLVPEDYSKDCQCKLKLDTLEFQGLDASSTLWGTEVTATFTIPDGTASQIHVTSPFQLRPTVDISSEAIEITEGTQVQILPSANAIALGQTLSGLNLSMRLGGLCVVVDIIGGDDDLGRARFF